MRELFYLVGQQLEDKAKGQMLWQGRNVKIVDGSTVLMADTPSNQATFPQVANQQEGSGFPIARLAAVFSLATGCIMDLAIGPYKGKQTGEFALVRELMHCFKPGDVVLGDAYYCSYFFVAFLNAMGVDVVFESHGARNVDFRQGERLGKYDHIVTWKKPAKPEWMDENLYALIPETISMREVAVTISSSGFRPRKLVVVTTMKNPRRVSKPSLILLYKQRWNCELDLRSLKTIMGMEMLRCQTPAMVQKEIWVHLLAYNLIRKVMMEAANLKGVLPRQISFKATIQILRAYLPLWQHHQKSLEEIYPHLLTGIGSSLVRKRPGRSEPRAVKRRPKPFPRLQGNRQDYKEHKA